VKKVVFIGAINVSNPPQGGEEYKNQLILARLKGETVDLIYFDTFEWKKKPLVVLHMLWCLFWERYDSVVISASSVSTYRLLNLVYSTRPAVLQKISYVVIGGYFPTGIRTGRFKSNIYNRLKSLVVEGAFIRNQLIGFIDSNLITVVPNFKNYPLIESPERENSNRVKFVFVGRISAAKGVGEIIEASNKLSVSNPKLDFEVDFYGPEEDIFNYTEICRYQGYLDFSNNPEDAYRKLNSYDCLLFPTTWKGEGFPGVIIDACIAGLPVIATDWNMNTEIIKNNLNGIIIPPNDVEALAKSMLWVINNRAAVNEMGRYNHQLAHKYHIDNVWGKLFSIIHHP